MLPPLSAVSIHLSPMSVTANVRPFPLAMKHFYSFVPQAPSLLVSALFRCFCAFVSQVCHCWCPPFSSAMQHFYSLVSQVCHCWCPPFSAGDATFLFICFPGLSLLVSALFRWACSISIHLFPGSVTGAAALFRWPCSISIHLSPM